MSLLDPSPSDPAAYLSAADNDLSTSLEQLVNLRSLEISPAATDAIDQTIATLIKLEQLSIVQGRAGRLTPMSAGELHAILNSPAPLRRVAISASLVEAWPVEDQQQVADAATRKGISFVKL